MRAREQEIETSDGTLRALVAGSGPALVCLHGLSANRTSWIPVARQVHEAFTVVAPDLLGRGASDAPAEARYRLGDELARARRVVTHALTAAAGAEGYLLAGHSQGAGLAVALAAGDPRCRGLVLANPVTPWTGRPPTLSLLRLPGVRRLTAGLLRRFRRPLAVWILRRRVFADPDAVTPALVERYVGPYAEPKRALALLRILADWRPSGLADHLPGRPISAAVVVGALDRRIGTGEARRLARRLRASFRILPRAAHAVPEERPGHLAAAVRRVAVRAGLASGGSQTVG